MISVKSSYPKSLTKLVFLHFLPLSPFFYAISCLQVGYVPIPRIEYTDDNLDLVVENLTLQGRNLFPNAIALEAHNFVKFSPYSAISDDSQHRFTLTFEQMQADMRDVAFYYRKKTGIPKMTDSGLADVLFGGHGLTVSPHPAPFYPYSLGTDTCVARFFRPLSPFIPLKTNRRFSKSRTFTSRSTRSSSLSATPSTTSCTRHSNHSLLASSSVRSRRQFGMP